MAKQPWRQKLFDLQLKVARGYHAGNRTPDAHRLRAWCTQRTDANQLIGKENMAIIAHCLKMPHSSSTALSTPPRDRAIRHILRARGSVYKY